MEHMLCKSKSLVYSVSFLFFFFFGTVMYKY